MSETLLADSTEEQPMEKAAAEASPASAAETKPDPAENTAAPWGQLPDDLKGLAQVKGWKSPADALKSYRHLEEFMGADKAGRGVVLPKDESDREAFDLIYARLGRPEKPDDYELDQLFQGDEIDDGLMSSMAQAMHESGLSKKQAQKMAEAYQGQWLAARDAQLARHNAEVAQARRELSPREQEEARRGFRFLELDNQDAAAIEYYLGVKKAARVLAKVGRALSEDKPVEGARAADLSHSPEAAGRRIKEKESDQLFLQRYLSGEKEAVAEMSSLYQLAYPENK